MLNGAAGLHASEGADDPWILNGLHAKVYVIERGSTAHLLIGSANATEAAFDGNVEVLVELIGKPGELGVEAVLGPRDRDEDGSARDRRDQSLRDLLEPYDPPGGEPADPAEDEQWRLEQALRDIAQVGFTMTVTAIGTDYDLTVEPAASLDVPLGTRLSVELITRPGEASWYERGTIGPAMFKRVPLSGVTPFLVLRAVAGDGLSRGCVGQAHMIGDPPGRHDEILARQIDTTEKFLRFVAALLGLTSGPSALLGLPGLASGPTSGSWGTTGLFELLVRSLADRPEALADLDRLVERLAATERGASILPDGFTELWQTIVGALEAVRGGAKAVDH